MKYEGCFEKDFCELNGKIGNWVENESKSEVLRGENWTWAIWVLGIVLVCLRMSIMTCVKL